MPTIALPRPPLTEGDIRLRPWERRDVKAVTAACQDPEIPRWTVVPHRYTERHARDFIHGTGVDLANGRELRSRSSIRTTACSALSACPTSTGAT